MGINMTIRCTYPANVLQMGEIHKKKRTLIQNRPSPFILIYLEQRQKHSALEKGVNAPHMKRP